MFFFDELNELYIISRISLSVLVSGCIGARSNKGRPGKLSRAQWNGSLHKSARVRGLGMHSKVVDYPSNLFVMSASFAGPSVGSLMHLHV